MFFATESFAVEILYSAPWGFAEHRRRRGDSPPCLSGGVAVPVGAYGQSARPWAKVIRSASRFSRIRISLPRRASPSAGTITFPLVGEISLAGLTPVGAGPRRRAFDQGKIRAQAPGQPQCSAGAQPAGFACSARSPARGVIRSTTPSSSLTTYWRSAGGISPTGDDSVT